LQSLKFIINNRTGVNQFLINCLMKVEIAFFLLNNWLAQSCLGSENSHRI
jgi:hypothetical protein